MDDEKENKDEYLSPESGSVDSEEISTEDESSGYYEHHNFIADPGQSLLRIDKFLYNRVENVSRSKIQAAAAAGAILVNKKPVKSNYKIKPGDVISVVMAHPPRDTELIPEKIELNIVYEDDDVLVINKQAGLVVHPGVGNYSGTLVNGLVHHFSDIPLFQGHHVRPGLVHRLDKDTSGIMVVAKNEYALTHLAKQFFDRTTDRSYIAIVWGGFQDKEGTIEGNIGRSRDGMRMEVYPNGDEGKFAVTHFRVLEDLGYLTVVECKLETGRTHQIRVHMKYIRHPLFNDERYGGNFILKGTNFTKYKQFVHNSFKVLPRHALHAKSLGFTHPTTGKWMFFNSDLPEDMVQLIHKWRAYIANRKEDLD
ncbi:MAG: RluA family pseudouridine synthase [Bacteroidales bacterium]|nr:RluA family pseudouridine synthase [Bacteroidales bacterium]